MSDELDTVTKVGGGLLGGGGLGFWLFKRWARAEERLQEKEFRAVRSELALARKDIARQEQEAMKLREELGKLRERMEGMSGAYRPELQSLQTRVGRLEGAAGIIGDGAATVPKLEEP